MSSARSSRKGVSSRRSKKSTEQTQVNAIIRANKVVNPEPPMFESSHHYVQRFRFVISTEVDAYPINSVDFANLLLMSSEASGVDAPMVCYPIYTRYLLKSVELWAIPNSLTAPVTLILTPQNVGTTVVNTERTLSDTSKSIDRYAYVKYKPKITSPIGQYQSQDSTGGGIRISAPGGAVCDVSLHVWICNGELPSPISVFVPQTLPQVTIAQGQVFLNALDSSPTGSSFFIPQGYINALDNTVTPTPRP